MTDANQAHALKAWPTPTPEQQVQFLRNMQRLLAEGLFVASYKFALIHALADLAVLKGEASGAPLELSTREIAAKFAELYWRQARPFQLASQATGLILQQNTGKQAAIITQIATAQQLCGGSLFRFKQLAPDAWSSLVADVDRVVREMPLWKLQTVGDERLEFLYANLDKGNTITLKPGVAYCFRAFYELIRDLIEGAWVRFVQRVNAEKLGNVADLGSFLFGQDRACLEKYVPILREVQRGLCLYCEKPLSIQSQVDHFVPWSRYPPTWATTSSWPTIGATMPNLISSLRRITLRLGLSGISSTRLSCKSGLLQRRYPQTSQLRCRSRSGCTSRPRRQVARYG